MDKINIVDFDDFSEQDNGEVLLNQLKVIIPNFKVTLFAIPSECSDEFLEGFISKYSDWIQLAVHGWKHSPLECKHWNKNDTLMVLEKCEQLETIEGKKVFQRIFKPPYWEISQGLYEAIKERNWIIADNPKNRKFRPKGLRVYELGKYSIHGHVGNICGNGLEEKFDEIYSKLTGKFYFISEYVDTKA